MGIQLNILNRATGLPPVVLEAKTKIYMHFNSVYTFMTIRWNFTFVFKLKLCVMMCSCLLFWGVGLLTGGEMGWVLFGGFNWFPRAFSLSGTISLISFGGWVIQV